ncbi:MAG TPA: ABC transporter ATP-binding protein [Chloroflexi bacterium]|nr:MAG: ABC transporter ATP-binding protein [Chloroflexota bacterium]HDD55242.1 ABC transporter ATP-binding protein [Chloroflexota bacterium]
MVSSDKLTSEFSLPEEYQVPEYVITSRKKPVSWLFAHFIQYWYLGLSLLVGAIGNASLAAVVPIIVGLALNALLEDPPLTSSLARLALIIVGTQLVRGALQLGRNFSAELLGQLMERDIRHEFYTSLLGKSMTYHSLLPVGDVMARSTNDVREINFMFSPGINLVVGSVNFILMPIIFASRYHPSLIAAPLIFLVLYILALWQYLIELKPITDSVRNAFGVLNSRLAEAVDGIETVKGMAEEASEVGLFASNARRFRNKEIHQGDVEARFLPLLVMGLTQAGGLFHAIFLYKQGLLQVGDIAAYFGLLGLLGFPTFVSLFAYSQISLGIASARRILELINRETELDQNQAGCKKELSGKIHFENVFYAYPGLEDTLQGLDFTIQPGQTVAIVGQTGAGKTTLAKLVNRTFDTSRGSIQIDDVDVRDWNLAALRRGISIIEQDIFLFSSTIAENIAFGKPDADREEIIRAAKSAQAHDFILSFQEGYDTQLGERGVTLSGGQRQRLALARAFLTDPRILILDDSTSSIDSATEDEIQKAIFEAARGRTTLIITHRLSQIRWADIILVLRKGKIIARGTHEELINSSPAYSQLFQE